MRSLVSLFFGALVLVGCGPTHINDVPSVTDQDLVAAVEGYSVSLACAGKQSSSDYLVVTLLEKKGDVTKHFLTVDKRIVRVGAGAKSSSLQGLFWADKVEVTEKDGVVSVSLPTSGNSQEIVTFDRESREMTVKLSRGVSHPTKIDCRNRKIVSP